MVREPEAPAGIRTREPLNIQGRDEVEVGVTGARSAVGLMNGSGTRSHVRQLPRDTEPTRRFVSLLLASLWLL